MNLDRVSNQIYIVAFNEAKLQKHEYFLPEHILLATLFFDEGKAVIENSGGNVANLLTELQVFFDEQVPKTDEADPFESAGLAFLFDSAKSHAANSGKNVVRVGDLLAAMFNQPESFAVYFMECNGIEKSSLLRVISHGINEFEQQEAAVSKKITRKEIDFIKSFASDLVEKAQKGLVDPLIGRDKEIERTCQVLCRRQKNNPVHVGDAGVGKTAVVEGIALKIVNGDVPKKLLDANVLSIDMGSVLAGTKYRGDFEERLKKILELISKLPNPIVYLDEIHTVIGAGSISGGAMDASNILKPYLSEGKIRFIGSTTFEEYKKHFEKDRALARRFQKVEINEPTVDQTIEILYGIKEKYETYHNVTYTDEAIKTAAVLSDKYINERYLPDKAIDVLDEAGAGTAMNSGGEKKVIDTDIIKAIVASIARIPTEGISELENVKLKNLADELKKEIFGQDKAVTIISDAIKRSRAGLNETERTVANLLFVGPTGVGKTEIAVQLAACLGISFVRFDMSEYQERHSVAKLIGAPPGYVGYEEGGLLTEAIRKTPHCVLLLDEIEKANDGIFNVLLQIMDYGRLTDNNGRKADFRNVIIIMTSNAGASDAYKTQIGFENMIIGKSAIKKEIEKVFTPEFRNRLDETVYFNGIDCEMAYLIAQKAIRKLNAKLAEKKVELTATEQAIKFIAENGITKLYGAREIMRVVDTHIKKPLVDEMLFGKLTAGGKASIDAAEAGITIRYSPCEMKSQNVLTKNNQ